MYDLEGDRTYEQINCRITTEKHLEIVPRSFLERILVRGTLGKCGCDKEGLSN